MQSRPPHSHASVEDEKLQRQYNAKIKVAHWTEALRLLKEMHQKGCPPNIFNYNCAINRCAQMRVTATVAAAVWDKTFRLLIMARPRPGDRFDYAPTSPLRLAAKSAAVSAAMQF